MFDPGSSSRPEPVGDLSPVSSMRERMWQRQGR
jgi:hypothetical protein